MAARGSFTAEPGLPFTPRLAWRPRSVAHALAHVRSHVQMLALLTASTAQVELTTKNFDKHVFGSGKSAFVKFLAPW